MSRPIIGVVAAAVIGTLTATAYFITTGQLEKSTRKDVEDRVLKAQELLIQNASLEMLGLLKQAESLARDPGFAETLRSATGKGRVTLEPADLAFRKFRAEQGERQPDLLALTNAKGQLVSMFSGPNPVDALLPDTYLVEGKVKYATLQIALEKRIATSAVWGYESKGPMKAAIAPIVDELDELVGAVLVAYAISADEAKNQQRLLGADVAYFYDGRVAASSFSKKTREELLAKSLFGGGLAEQALGMGKGVPDVRTITLGSDEYIATAGRLPGFESSKPPPGYPAVAGGATVLMSLSEASSAASKAGLAILLVGLGALIIAILATLMTARSILGPVDRIEMGINDIINGNLERTFQPMGSDLNGLANALNVMLARFLGRPEPGEEEFDDDGNLVRATPMTFASEGLSPKDAAAMALAHEPEQSYYRRVFDEFVSAQRSSGEGADGVDFDSFVNKLRINEANLKQKYQCRSVRFKVEVTDGKVTLKPVPIT